MHTFEMCPLVLTNRLTGISAGGDLRLHMRWGVYLEECDVEEQCSLLGWAALQKTKLGWMQIFLYIYLSPKNITQILDCFPRHLQHIHWWADFIYFHPLHPPSSVKTARWWRTLENLVSKLVSEVGGLEKNIESLGLAWLSQLKAEWKQPNHMSFASRPFLYVAEWRLGTWVCSVIW